MINSYNIIDYGAVAGDKSAQTAAIQKAIDDADRNHGTVVIPSGIFVTGTLDIKGANICLCKGAVLLASPKREDYRNIGYLHCEFGETVSLLYSLGHSRIKLYGEGTIDLGGRYFFDFDTYNLPSEYKDNFKEAQKLEATALCKWRPNQSIFFANCTDVSVEGVTILDAPCWTMTFSECERVRVESIVNIGHPRIPNNDGIHVTACRGVIIHGCDIESADDCVAVSSITNWSRPCEDIIISDCRFKSFSKAIVLGYSHSIVRNVTITNCQIRESNRGLCVMPAARTGYVGNVAVSNLYIDTRVRAGNWWGNGEPIFIYSLPHTTYDHIDFGDELSQRNFKVTAEDIVLSGIVCASENAAGVVGTDGNIRGVTLRDITIKRKPSDNIGIKGHTFDTSPAKPLGVEIADDVCLYVSGAEAVVENLRGRGVDGESARIVYAQA